MDPLRDYAWHFAIALGASMLATLGVRTAARRLGWAAKPRPDRWHKKPTALFGGIGIYAGFLTAYLARRPAALGGDAILVACATGMFLLGLIDDRYPLQPYAKLVGQIVCATAVTVFGLRLGWLANPVIDQGLTIFWLVGLTNALNLLDNIDGAAAGISAIGGVFLIYFCHTSGRVESAVMAAAFTGSVLGFLVFNFNPASIFMGDCGSLFLGFFLGGLSITTSQVGARRSTMGVLAVPVLILLMPILDTTLVTISRRYHGLRVSQGGRDHTSHRLVALGLSERSATLSLWAIAATSGGIAILVRNMSDFFAAGVIAAFGFSLIFLMIFLGRVKVYKIDDASLASGRTLLPTLADFSHKRRVFETLNDLFLIMLSYYGAFLLRFDNEVVMRHYFPLFVRSLPLVIVTQLGAFLFLGLYRGVWRYTGMDDLARILRAVGAAILLSAATGLFVIGRAGVFPRIVVLDGLLLLLGVAGSRISFRFLRSWIGGPQLAQGRRVLIYGAGDGGELLARELRNNPELGMVAVGFVDDDPKKAGRVIHGVPVIGPGDAMGRLLTESQVQEVVLSTTKLAASRWQRIEELCVQQGLVARRLRIAFD